MAKIKICGLRRTEDIEAVNKLKPDFAGFIISKGFKRTVSDISSLLALLDKDIKSVGVFVDDSEELVLSSETDFVQLHGGESPSYCERIQKSKKVIKFLKPDSFHRVKEYEPFVDYFLFDSGTGTGKTFDWSALPKTEKPFFLAGGLSSDNLEKAALTGAYAFDMSSSVETDGVKDFNKIKEVIDIVRRIK